jgi:hypothetical protein
MYKGTEGNPRRTIYAWVRKKAGDYGKHGQHND